MSALPRAIIEAAARGLRVFPVKAGGKLPLIAEWPDRASSDPDVLGACAREYPHCNWGVAIGQPSGVFVIDIDGEEGRASMVDLERQGFTLPATLTVTTGRADGGEHCYYRMPQGIDVRNDQSGRIAPHVDVRGTGGFVVCPPSTHASGKQYRFTDRNAAIADAPVWVIERLTVRQPKAAVAGDGVIGPGSRTPLLASLAGKMHSQGIPAAGIEAALKGLNATFTPPHPPEKVLNIVAGITRRHEAGRLPQERRPDLICLEDVASRAVDWLWKPYLPKGMLAMLSGDPGAEKTGTSRAGVYAKMELCLFPRPIRTGSRTVAWIEDEVNAWIDARIAGANDDAIRKLVAKLQAPRTEPVSVQS